MGGASGESAKRPKRAKQGEESQKPTDNANKDNELEPLDEKSLGQVTRETPL